MPQSISWPVACCCSVTPLHLAQTSWVPGGHQSAVHVVMLPLPPNPAAAGRSRSCPSYKPCCCLNHCPASRHSAVPAASLSNSPLSPRYGKLVGVCRQLPLPWPHLEDSKHIYISCGRLSWVPGFHPSPLVCGDRFCGIFGVVGRPACPSQPSRRPL